MGDKILKQIRIMDLSRVLAGPWATQLLADYGAEIIKLSIQLMEIVRENGDHHGTKMMTKETHLIFTLLIEENFH